jgi:type III secretion protein N (ATPase)
MAATVRFNEDRLDGRVTGVIGLLIHVTIPDCFIGEICTIWTGGGPVRAEVVGFRHGETLMMALGESRYIAANQRVVASGKPLEIPVGDNLLGRVLDGLGQPLEDEDEFRAEGLEPIDRDTPHPIDRVRITERLETGIGVIDTMLPCGKGQRVGIFAPAGGGKSTLMGQLARFINADVKVIVLVGERGREVNDFLYELDKADKATRKSSVLVVATSDKPSVVRMKSAYVGTTIAEYFRDEGKNVLLMMDSVTRFARALREIGLARGEPPARYGFPPSVFAELPRLFERCGNSSGKGRLTGFYTVLVEGDNLSEPVADETKSLLDGHIILSTKVKRRPAIDLLQSESRVRDNLADVSDVKANSAKLLDFLKYHDTVREAIEFGFFEDHVKGNHIETLKTDFDDEMNQKSTDGARKLSDSLNTLARFAPKAFELTPRKKGK